jgi:hypothetical protein
MRRARVSARLASAMRYSTAYLFAPLSVAKNARASSLPASACSRSAGTVTERWPS